MGQKKPAGGPAGVNLSFEHQARVLALVQRSAAKRTKKSPSIPIQSRRRLRQRAHTGESRSGTRSAAAGASRVTVDELSDPMARGPDVGVAATAGGASVDRGAVLGAIVGKGLGAVAAGAWTGSTAIGPPPDPATVSLGTPCSREGSAGEAAALLGALAAVAGAAVAISSVSWRLPPVGRRRFPDLSPGVQP